MTNKLVVIINSLKVPKIKKILLYEMKFLVPNYSCLQNPWLGGYRPQIPFLFVLCPQLNLLNSPRRKKFLGTPLSYTIGTCAKWSNVAANSNENSPLPVLRFSASKRPLSVTLEEGDTPMLLGRSMWAEHSSGGHLKRPCCYLYRGHYDHLLTTPLIV